MEIPISTQSSTSRGSYRVHGSTRSAGACAARPAAMDAERRSPQPPGGQKPARRDGTSRTKQSGKPTHAEARAACMVRANIAARCQ